MSQMNNRQTQSREQLLHWIQMVSFACLDTAIFLDTHPESSEALAFYQKHLNMRKQAMEEYSRLYGPLTLDLACNSDDCWNWINQPWPWERGNC